ncbi:MAG: DUF1292 domain-containing protein [Clostridiales bacterium]|jgi:uncharacterized protein YrzB (UPF0473 family)|nr:DUF1292 domain-containing protein [Clostridiales bacterium]
MELTMSEEYGSDFIVIADEEGNEYELEHLDTIEDNEDLYMAFLPVVSDEDSEEANKMIILKVVEEDGEELFEAIEDDNELERIYDIFMEQLFGDEQT